MYASKAGTILHPGDTGADGDSWIMLPAQLAVAMMPGNAHVPLWQHTVVRDALVAWSRPADDTNATVVNGASVASWMNGAGSNVLSTGDLFNHHRYAPDYSTLIYQNMQAILVSALAGQPAPRAVTALIAPVYAAYTTVSYAAPPNRKPGGTVYPPNSATIYYPQGCDWGTGQMLPYALVDAESAAFGVGTTASAAYADLHANAELAMQKLHADGHTYDTSAQYVYVGREEHTAQLAGQLYLALYVRDHSLSAFSDSSYWLGS
jgi:transposase